MVMHRVVHRLVHRIWGKPRGLFTVPRAAADQNLSTSFNKATIPAPGIDKIDVRGDGSGCSADAENLLPGLLDASEKPCSRIYPQHCLVSTGADADTDGPGPRAATHRRALTCISTCGRRPASDVQRQTSDVANQDSASRSRSASTTMDRQGTSSSSA